MLLLTWPAQVHAHNSIPDNIMFGQIRLKTLADDKINMARKLNFMHRLVENIAGLLYRRKCRLSAFLFPVWIDQGHIDFASFVYT